MKFLLTIIGLLTAVSVNAQIFRQGATRPLTAGNITVSNITSTGSLKLSGQTNELTVVDGALKLDGSAVGGGATIGDPFVVTSSLTDNATNVAVIVDTDAAWDESGPEDGTLPGALLFSLRNNGVEQLSASHNGGLTIGSHSIEYYGDNAEEGSALISYRDVGSGEADWNQIVVGVFNSTNEAAFGESALYADQASSGWSLRASGGNTIRYTAAEENVSALYYVGGNNIYTIFKPSAADGVLPYLLDVAHAHTSGNLLEVSNDETNKFSVAFDGAITIAGTLTTQGGTASTPASAGASGTAGEIRWDANFIYVCVAPSTWKRVAIATW